MRIALLANSDWYIYNYRLLLAKKLKESGNSVTILTPPGHYHDDLIEAGFSWRTINISRQGLNPFVEFLALWRLWRLYQHEKFDVVHQFTIKPVIYGSLAAKLAKIPNIINSITGLGYVFISRGFTARLLRELIIRMFRLALKGTRVIFQNQDDLNLFLDQRIVANQNASLIQGSGVDTERFTYTKEPSGIPKVIMASRLIWEKGVGEFVEAAKLVNRNGNLARFILVGEPDLGNPSAVSVVQIEEWVEAGIIEWLGWQTDIPTVLSEANIVCLPSYYAEGLPRILLEAAACGRAVIATDVPGCRDIVQDGENGILLPPQDVRALANAVKELIEDPELRKRMGLKSRQVVAEGFSVDKINTQTIDLYPDGKT